MFQVIAAIFGFASSVDKGAKDQLNQQLGMRENDLSYTRSKILGIYQQDAQQMLLFGGLALILAIIIALMIFKKSK